MSADADSDVLRDRLARLGVIAPDESPAMTPLTGGVSSHIWRVDTRRGPVCVKQAVPQLKVAAHWEAPLSRSHSEADYLRAAGAIVPGRVPALLAEDAEAALLVLAYLAPESHPVWKAELRDGRVSIAIAEAVGDLVVAIHAATAGDPAMAARFDTGDAFHALRLEPYLEATARVHEDLAPALEALVARTAATKRCLVHGDVSPKNILVGPDGPVLLDAECAWYGDPAFDLAFVLNHLLLKGLWTPQAGPDFLAAFDALAARYLAGVGWEDPAALEARAASLLPGLFLARVDGKSPVEYVTEERDRESVRRVARRFLADPPSRLAAIRAAWHEERFA
ncbi:MAG: aminoglycoside phosphotransferase family protein [Azospirillaceae bacterium]